MPEPASLTLSPDALLSAQLAAWLRAKPADEPVGWALDADDCPIGRMLQEAGYSNIIVDGWDLTYHWPGGGFALVFACDDPLLFRFVSLVDLQTTERQLTAGECRRLLREAGQRWTI